MTDTSSLLRLIADQVAQGSLIPYLGPEVLSLGAEAPPVPTGARELAHLLASRVGVPGRIRNNLWHSAQYIESHRHRMTLDKLMAEFFRPVPEPGPIHTWLAGLTELPLIIDTWYDGTMAAALKERSDWGLIQGASKARRVDVAPWYRAYDSTGTEQPVEAAQNWRTLLYKPHGAAQPAGDILVSDSDYVEVLSEIDIQSPIPAAIQQLRTDRSFLFLGCRFYDQILRSFARSIIKRSSGQSYAVVPAEGLTPNEIRFFATERITPLPIPLADAAALLTGRA